MPGYCILFVDDDADDYHIFSDLVKEINGDANILYVQDSSDIDAFLAPPLPDIVILDFNMPKLNGIGCLKKIRAKKEFDKIPVVLYSVFYDRIDEAYKNGANYFIVKQTSINRMKDGINLILHRNWKDESVFKNFDVCFRDDEVI